ncbi:MAG: zinc ribbon domain-containing protein [Clostridia bacterium]|nr:zinc ribbon domain-containing protein [Clostridia bacterium]
MSPERKCEYCGAELRGKEPFCPKCGTYDQSLIPESSRFSVIRPQTVEELMLYCREHGIPLSMLDHSIGEDIDDAPMNGIFRDGAHVTVYENAPSGERFIVYSGNDESRAAGLYFSRLIDSCHAVGIFPERMAGLSDPGSYRLERSTPERQNIRYGGLLAAALAVLGAIIVVFIISKIAAHWGDGYYSAGSDYYYKDGKTWYINSDFGWIDYEFVDEDYPVDFLGEEYSPEWPFNEFLQRADVDSLEELNGLDDDVITDDASEQD